MNGKFWKWFHFTFIWLFVAIWAYAWKTDLVSSTKFISHISMVALVYAAASAWQAARAEQKEDDR